MLEPTDHLLASVFYRSEDEKKLATRNALRLKAHRTVFREEIDKQLWSYVQKYLMEERLAPSLKVLQGIIDKNMATQCSVRLETLAPMAMCQEEEFVHFHKQAFEELKKRDCSILLSTAANILAGTYKAKRGEKERDGHQAAIRYILEKGMDFLYEDNQGQKLRGDIRKDAAEMIKRYQTVKENRSEGVGILTGLDTIDLQTQGIKKGELWIVGGFTSDGKTTICLNIAHNAVVNGYNVMFASMEMSREDVRDILYCIHSGHRKFRNVHPSLSLREIQQGELDAEAEQFYLNHVIPDFEKNKNYGVCEVVQPTEIWTAETVQAEAELLNEHLPGGLDLVIPDYIGLMGADGKSEGRNEDLNRIIRGLKQMTLTFGGGKQIAVLSPFQCNREGNKRAKENSGIYDLQALSSAHEAERSSDVVITTFLNDELRDKGEAVICQLKGRKSGCAPPRNVSANLASRIVREDEESATALESSNWMDNLIVGV